MTEPLIIPWKRIAIEAAAIVASILLAFAIDAWWADRQARIEVRETLAIVLSDFRESKEGIHFRQVRAEEKMKAIEQLMEASFAESNNLSEQTIDRLLGGTAWFAVGNTLSIEALDTLLDSGQLQTIENSDLRRDLADWPRYYDYVDKVIERDAALHENVWLPLMMEIGYLPQLAVTMNHAPGFPEITFAVPVAPGKSIQHSILFSDNRFHNLLVDMWWVQSDVRIELESLEASTTSTIEMLEAELGI